MKRYALATFVFCCLPLAPVPANGVTAWPGSVSQVESPHYGVLVMAHGGDEEWNQQVLDAVAGASFEVPVQVAFGMADRATLQASIRELEAQGVRRIVVVRLFVSAESFLPQTEYLLGLDPRVPDFVFDSNQTVGMRPVADPGAVQPIDHRSDIVIVPEGLVDVGVTGRILAERALGLSVDAARETVLVIAHGHGDDAVNDRLLAALQQRVPSIEQAAPFRKVVAVALREDWPEKRELAEREIREFVRRESESGDVIVIPFRVSGFGPYATVLDGLRYKADHTGLLPHQDAGLWARHSARRLACQRRWVDDCNGSRGQETITRRGN